MILRLDGHRERVDYTLVVDGEVVRRCRDATDARRDVTCRTRTFADLQSTATANSLLVDFPAPICGDLSSLHG